MTYEFECGLCYQHFDLIRSAADSQRVAICPWCFSPMGRIYSAPQVNVQQAYAPSYNPAFGKVINGKHHLKDEIRRINGEEGRTIIEIGNENWAPDLKPIPKSYDED